MPRVDRHERKLAYKLTEPPMGICAVRNLRNGKVYLERTMNTEGLLNRFRFALKLGGHPVPALQADWNAQGGSDFAFEVLERLEPAPGTSPKEALAALEARWLARLTPYGHLGYHRHPT